MIMCCGWDASARSHQRRAPCATKMAGPAVRRFRGDDYLATRGPVTTQRNNDGPAALMTSRRLDAFSDGVFAIAITLLVLDLAVPARNEIRTRGLGSAVAHQWPSYFA